MTSKSPILQSGLLPEQKPLLDAYIHTIENLPSQSIPNIVSLFAYYRENEHLYHPSPLPEHQASYTFKDDYAFLIDDQQIIGHVVGGITKINRGYVIGNHEIVAIKPQYRCETYECFTLDPDLHDELKLWYSYIYYPARVQDNKVKIPISNPIEKVRNYEKTFKK